jgi:hypothetical protein
MARIKIVNLPKGLKISKKEMNRIAGGAVPEEMALRLYMAVDRRSKTYSTLSSIMKNISSTQESIIQNLK